MPFLFPFSSNRSLSHRPERPQLHLFRLLLIETILAQKIIGDIDSESRSCNGVDRLLVSPQTAHYNFAEYLFVGLEELEDEEVGDRQARMYRGYRADGPVRIMGSHRDVIGVCHRRDLLEFGDAASAGDIRLDDAHGLPFQQLTEAVPAEDALSRGQRDIDGALYLRHCRDVLRWD